MLASTAMPTNALVACHPLRTGHTRRHVLAIDIGGSGLKAAVVDEQGALASERARVDTPVGSHPDEFVQAIAALVQPLPPSELVAVGFPGMVRDGVVRTAPNLGHEAWHGFALAPALERVLHRPVRLANDADVQGLAVITRAGLEMVITLGTGFGTSLYQDGRLCPHLEIAHLPFRKGETYDEQLGDAARKRIGNKKWRKRVLAAIEHLRTLTLFDRLFVGGGNARRLRGQLPIDVTCVDNSAGISGGAFLWRD